MKMNLTKKQALLESTKQTCSTANFPEYPAGYDEFVTDTWRTAKTNGINIRYDSYDLPYDEKDNQIGWGGYFSPERRELVISTCNSTSELMLTFIHESCHMDQWLQDKKVSSCILGYYFDFLER